MHDMPCILQAFALKTVKHASAWIDLPSLLEGQNSHKAGGGKVAESEDISDCHIPASEQAQIYLLMAEAVLVDFRPVSSPAPDYVRRSGLD